MKKTTQLKNLIESKDLSFIMEAHNGLSAKIVEEAGFKGIWGSGLSISAAMGVRDNNEASWTQVLEVCEFMSDATTVPILLDGDTGYGNFNNMRRLVHKLEQRGIAGVCIEDKIFPKTNSFLRAEQQPLADIDEFAGKIKAGLDARSDDDFCIVARVEAFIAGWGLKEALKRAEAYRQAGATAILMHSSLNKPDEIFAFTKEWAGRSPVVIVPTKYYATPTDEFRKHGINVAIWANHTMRSSVRAMQDTVKEIYEKESLLDVEDKVVSVKEVFRLQNDQELAEAEKKYFSSAEEAGAIILAASRGKELADLTIDKPKALLEVNGKPILSEMVNKLQDSGIKNVTVVRGYKKEAFPKLPCAYVDNDKFETTGELYSLYLAKDNMKDSMVISYGDIVFRKYVLNLLEESKADVSIVVDSDTSKRANDYKGDFVTCSSANTRSFDQTESTLVSTNLIAKSEAGQNHGEWIGLLKTTAKGTEVVKAALEKLADKSNFQGLKMGDLINQLIADDVQIGVSYIEGHWMDIDNFNDFEKVQVF